MDLIIYTLATWRLAHLLVEEDGPFDVLTCLREFVGVRLDDIGASYGTNVLADGLTCVWCVSVWIGAMWTVLYYVMPDVTFWLALPLALSAGAVFINGVIEWLEQAQ